MADSDDLTEGARFQSQVAAKDLRESGGIRQQVASELSRVQSVLDGMMVDRPRRRIIRPTTPKEVS